MFHSRQPSSLLLGLDFRFNPPDLLGPWVPHVIIFDLFEIKSRIFLLHFRKSCCQSHICLPMILVPDLLSHDLCPTVIATSCCLLPHGLSPPPLITTAVVVNNPSYVPCMPAIPQPIHHLTLKSVFYSCNSVSHFGLTIPSRISNGEEIFACLIVPKIRHGCQFVNRINE